MTASAGCAGADCGSVTMPASTNTITGIADFIRAYPVVTHTRYM
jgi:hypothetical protein